MNILPCKCIYCTVLFTELHRENKKVNFKCSFNDVNIIHTKFYAWIFQQRTIGAGSRGLGIRQPSQHAGCCWAAYCMIPAITSLGKASATVLAVVGALTGVKPFMIGQVVLALKLLKAKSTRVRPPLWAGHIGWLAVSHWGRSHRRAWGRGWGHRTHPPGLHTAT